MGVARERENGPITFYYVTAADEVVIIKQWERGGSCYQRMHDGQFERLTVEVPEGKWMHEYVQTWCAVFEDS